MLGYPVSACNLYDINKYWHLTPALTLYPILSRELQYKIKGISMSEFTKEDVAALAAMGNNAHNAKYLARHTPRDHHPIPNGSDVNKLRDFIKMKYVDKRWYSDDEAPPAAQSSHQTAPAPAPQSHFGVPARPAQATSDFDPFGSSSAPALAPHAPAASSGFGDFDPFGSSEHSHHSHSTPQPATHVPQAPPASSGFGDFDPFGSSEHSHSTPQPAVRPGPSNDWDAFGSPSAPPPAPVAPAAPPAASNQWDAFGSAPAAHPAPAPLPPPPPPAHGNSFASHVFGGGSGSGSFDPFGSAPAAPAAPVPAATQGYPQADYFGQQQHNAHAPALSPSLEGHPAPASGHAPAMPFVKLHRDVNPPPAAAEEPGLSGFSAFDALSVDSASTPVHGGSVSDANPFGGPAHHEQHPPSNGYPAQQGGYYPQQQAPPPQQQQYGYGGQPQGGYPPAGYPAGPGGGGGYPPAPSGGYNGYQGGGYGYPPQQQNGQYGGYPPGGEYLPQQGTPAQHAPAGYGYPPQGAPGQPHQNEAPAAPPPADPFADMAAGAWNASGGRKQRGSVTSVAPAPNLFSAAPAPQAPPPASANPFDLF